MARVRRNDWVREAAMMLGEIGAEALSIESLCQRLGVTKGSFYWHFKDRAELLSAVLEDWERLGTEAIIEVTDGLGPDPRVRLQGLIKTIFGESTPNDALESEIRVWAGLEESAQEVVARVDQRRIEYVEQLLRAVGAKPSVARHRSALLYRTLIGEFTWRRHGGEPLTKPARQELDRWVLAGL